jgi:hypothetical protein
VVRWPELGFHPEFALAAAGREPARGRGQTGKMARDTDWSVRGQGGGIAR